MASVLWICSNAGLTLVDNQPLLEKLIRFLFNVKVSRLPIKPGLIVSISKPRLIFIVEWQLKVNQLRPPVTLLWANGDPTWGQGDFPALIKNCKGNHRIFSTLPTWEHIAVASLRCFFSTHLIILHFGCTLLFESWFREPQERIGPGPLLCDQTDANIWPVI